MISVSLIALQSPLISPQMFVLDRTHEDGAAKSHIVKTLGYLIWFNTYSQRLISKETGSSKLQLWSKHEASWEWMHFKVNIIIKLGGPGPEIEWVLEAVAFASCPWPAKHIFFHTFLHIFVQNT